MTLAPTPFADLAPTGVRLRETLKQAKAAGTSEQLDLVLKAWNRSWQSCGLAPILPLMFSLSGKPFSLRGHFMMEPLYKLAGVPRMTVLKAGRQVSKSTSLSFQGVARSATLPYFNTLYVTPLFEQIRRFSQNYVKPAIDDSTLAALMTEDGGTENVLQRTLNTTKSTMFFGYAFNSCDRLRGVSVNSVVYDEVQGLNMEFIPVINEAMSAREYRLEQYSGTPLTMDNPLESLWQQTSQAEWAIKCEGCGHTNLAGFQYDLMKMLGKNGLVCSKCSKPLITQNGYWYHTLKDRRNQAVGYHLPQCIFPMHCQDEERWAALLKKRDGPDTFAFMTECLGESWDSGAKLVTLTQLREASTLPWKNDFYDMLNACSHSRHQLRVLSIDWSGGGAKEESLTAFSILGLTHQGDVEVIWMKKYHHSADYMDDAARAIQAFKSGLCHYLVHDAAGQGIAREQILIHAGMPKDKIIPVAYVSAMAGKTMMRYNPPDSGNNRKTYSLVKNRSIAFVCELIKQGKLKFPEWESSQACSRDFMALVEETMQTPRGSDIYLINKAQGIPDDMAHSVTMGTCALYYHVQQWPDLADTVRGISLRALAEADPSAADPVEMRVRL